jgi:hypothetical protein
VHKFGTPPANARHPSTESQRFRFAEPFQNGREMWAAL